MYNKAERINLEEIIIGSCLIDNYFETAKKILTHKDFDYPRNLIFTAFTRLSEENSPIDIKTTFRLLERKGMNVPAKYIAQCAMVLNTMIHLKHCLILLEYNLEEDIMSILKENMTRSGIEAQLASNCMQKVLEKPDIIETNKLITAYLFTRSPNSSLTKEILALKTSFEKRCHKIKLNLS